MSNRILVIMVSLAVAICASLALLTLFPVSPGGDPYERFQGFRPAPHDRPVVETLDGYYQLVSTGWTTIWMDGVEYRISAQDMELAERRQLSQMLRVP